MGNIEDGQIASLEGLRSLVESTFPQEELAYAFGYGSGVFTQQVTADKSSAENLIDVILVVNDSYAFHRDNIQRNPDHYIHHFFTSDPAARITWWQRHSVENSLFRNPRVYFNVTPGLKYGVVQVEDIVSDLQQWKYLYLAGRLHKPTVEILNRQSSSPIHDSVLYHQQMYNLPSALATALLLLYPVNNAEAMLSPTQVYAKIASLSYTGDFRTIIGAEDPDKIIKLVNAPGQYDRFQKLYKPSIDLLQTQGIIHVSSSGFWSLDTSESAKNHLSSKLPTRLRDHPNLAAALTGIVAPAARYQSIKGLATAGFARSATYAARKLSKGIFRFVK